MVVSITSSRAFRTATLNWRAMTKTFQKQKSRLAGGSIKKKGDPKAAQRLATENQAGGFAVGAPEGLLSTGITAIGALPALFAGVTVQRTYRLAPL